MTTATTKTTISIRTNAATKRAAQKVFTKLGLDLSTGVNMYLARVAQDQAMPFTPRTANGYTLEQEQKILAEVAWAEKHGKRYRTVEEAMRALD